MLNRRVCWSVWLSKVNRSSGLGPPSLAPAWLGFSSLVHYCAMTNRSSSSKRGSRWMERRETWETLCRLAAWRTKSTSRRRSSSPRGEYSDRGKNLKRSKDLRVNPPLHLQVPEVSHQEVPEEEQPAWLAQGGGVWQGDVRAALLPDQPGGWRVWGGRVKGWTEQNKFKQWTEKKNHISASSVSVQEILSPTWIKKSVCLKIECIKGKCVGTDGRTAMMNASGVLVGGFTILDSGITQDWSEAFLTNSRGRSRYGFIQ